MDKSDLPSVCEMFSNPKLGVTTGVALDDFNRCCNGCYNRLGIRQLTQDRRIKKP